MKKLLSLIFLLVGGVFLIDAIDVVVNYSESNRYALLGLSVHVVVYVAIKFVIGVLLVRDGIKTFKAKSKH